MQLVILESNPPFFNLCSLNLEELFKVSLPPKADHQTAQTNLSKTAYILYSL